MQFFVLKTTVNLWKLIVSAVVLEKFISEMETAAAAILKMVDFVSMFADARAISGQKRSKWFFVKFLGQFRDHGVIIAIMSPPGHLVQDIHNARWFYGVFKSAGQFIKVSNINNISMGMTYLNTWTHHVMYFRPCIKVIMHGNINNLFSFVHHKVLHWYAKSETAALLKRDEK